MRIFKLSILFFGLLIFIIPNIVYAQLLVQNEQTYDLVEHIQWQYGTPKDSLDSIQLMDEASWLKSPDKAMSLGVLNKVVWVKFELKINQSTASKNYILELNNATLFDIQLYQFTPSNQSLTQGPLGMSHAFDSARYSPIPNNHFNLDLTQNGTHLIFLRIHQNGYFDLPLKLHTPKYAFDIHLNENFLSSLFYGFFIALTIYHLFYFLIIRDPIYLSYLFFTSGVALLFGYIDGITFKYFWPNHPILNIVSSKLSVPLLSLSIILLCMNFLILKKENIKLKRFAYTILTINALTVTFSIFLSNYIYLQLALPVFILTLITVPIISLIHFFLHRDFVSLVFLASISIFIMINMFVGLSAMKLTPVNVDDLWNILKMIMGFQMIVFASAIAFRIRHIDKERKKALNDSQAKSEMIAKVSHELRTPLNGILGLSHIMKPLLNDDTKAYNNMIHQSATSLLTVINDLLDVSRINAGKFTINNTPTAIHELINSVSNSLFSQLDTDLIVGAIHIEDNVPKYALADTDRLRQLISNLLGNSIKYTHHGSICIDVCAIEDIDDTYRFNIIDTGVGINQEDVKRIFNPFEQANKSNHSSQTSTGLGLFITQQLAKAMLTEVKVSSIINKGSSFWFDIKLTPCPAIKTVDDLHTKNDKKLNILVAEDNDINQLIINKLLSNFGHNITIKANGLLAFEQMKQTQFDLILMDCDMPILDGYQATKQFREFEKMNNLKHTKILALTAHAYQGHEEKVLDCGMDGQILKPIKPKELELILKSII